ncbi:GntR family transcriptional regulator [Flaviflexus huanghaiensis]|uniref:GntR family transcriptional regulator n=1 Tax=Flaviflexus huanghaiensis TaxID=1111473 RepID=UPI0030CA16ED
MAEQGVSHVLGDLKSFTEIIEDLGMKPGVRDVTIYVDPDPPSEAVEFLPGKHLWLIERVRTANGQPFCLMQSWLADAAASSIVPSHLEETQSLYRILADMDLRPAHATEIIRAEAATLAEARMLGVEQGTPLLTAYRWTSDSRGQPIEYVRSTSPGNRYQYVIKLQQ